MPRYLATLDVLEVDGTLTRDIEAETNEEAVGKILAYLSRYVVVDGPYYS